MLTLIATILPNGIDKEGNYQFSLCIDMDVNTEPCENENCSDFFKAIYNFPKICDKIYADGINLMINSQSVKIENKNLTPTHKKLRDEIWYNYIFKEKTGIKNGSSFINLSKDLHVKNFYKDSTISQKLNRVLVAKSQRKIEDDKLFADFKALHKETINVKRNLKAIHEYADFVNSIQAKELFEKNAFRVDSVEKEFTKEQLFDITSFITSNIILQRILGFTIDFTVEKSKLDGIKEFTISYSDKPDLSNESIKVNWINPISLMINHEVDNRKLVLMSNNDIRSEDLPAAVPSEKYTTSNYNPISYLQSSSNIFEKISLYENSKDFFKAYELLYNSEITPNFTNGINIHFENIVDEINESKLLFYNSENSTIVKQLDTNKLLNETILLEKNVIMGNSFGVLNDKQIFALGKRKCSVLNLGKKIDLHDNLKSQEFIVNTDTGMKVNLPDEVVRDAQGRITEGPTFLLIDNIILNWTGENIGLTSSFSNYEDEKNFEAHKNEGSISDAGNTTFEMFHKVFKEKFFPYVHSFEHETGGEITPEPKLIFDYKFEKNSNPKLIFGRTYQFIIVNKYKNGWGISLKKDDNNYEWTVNELYLHRKKLGYELTSPFTFKRNEPVKHVSIFLGDKLVENGKQIEGKEGESLNHWVIKDGEKNCIRYILPPPISFQYALWHGKIFEMSTEESYSWYKKYHSDPNDSRIEKIGMEEYYNNSPLPNYLPDPLSIGFIIELFYDKDRKEPAKEYSNIKCLFDGEYPFIEAWQIVVEDDNNFDKIKIYKDSRQRKITIKVKKGLELYGEIRTILHESHQKVLEPYGTLTPSLNFSITHAIKQPLIEPRFYEHEGHITAEASKEINSSILDLKAEVHIEQLNLKKISGESYVALPGILPTGELELYAKWEEYIDDPNQILSSHPNLSDEIKDWTPEQPINKIDTNSNEDIKYECKLDFGNQNSKKLLKAFTNKDESINYIRELNFKYDIKSTKYFERYFYLKNKSKYTGYYPAYLNDFEKVSTQGICVKIKNSKKPAKPIVNKIIPLLVKKIDSSSLNNKTTITSKGNRIRIYLERGRLTSGKGERVAVILNNEGSNETKKSIYNEHYLKYNLISKVGKDIASDLSKPKDNLFSSEEVYLNKSNIMITNFDELDDMSKFYPQFVPELGCMTYLPKFSREQNLWYFDMEFIIKNQNGSELHSPFFQLSLAHYQEESFNYNIPNGVNIEKDCRISDVEKTNFIYILPTRTLTVTETTGTVKLSLKFDKSSLAIRKSGSSTKTKFYVTIQNSLNGIIWNETKINNDFIKDFVLIEDKPEYILQFEPDRYTKYRLLFVEVENYNDIEFNNFSDIVESKYNRIIGVNIFKLEKVYT